MDAEQTQQAVEDLEPQVERLKSLYQQYFMGIEKVPPAVLRKNVDRVIWQLRRERLPTTTTRFKFQQIIQRYNTYQQYWTRILRQIENGTYKRDAAKAAQITAPEREREIDTLVPPPKKPTARPIEEATATGSDEDTTAGDDDDDAPTPPSLRCEPSLRCHDLPQIDESDATEHAPVPARAAPGAPAAAAPGGAPAPGATGAPARRPLPPPRPSAASIPAIASVPPPASQPGGPRDQRTMQIYEQYLDARRRAGESTAGLSYERVAKSLQAQSDKLRAQYPNRAVDYEVATKDGKAVIRPVVK